MPVGAAGCPRGVCGVGLIGEQRGWLLPSFPVSNTLLFIRAREAFFNAIEGFEVKLQFHQLHDKEHNGISQMFRN